ncbi:hypothetical protein GCM10011575_42300 [Microlunatus endophyticus]|uniref:DUF211 domain-containing protein n=1 Tax=Microlunatus endophyticus TaxID=1716077 RepID=A0A917W936_9ACTN|nr:DUF211 domain-containing protein [Microlunatus endophyticus]GGL79526.1 hypothetical protein GCM10011575_42300 [Microlunatus endophyticus]
MNLRRVVLDVDKALHRPELIEIAEAISQVPGVESTNIAVNEIDVETVGTNITVEGTEIDYDALLEAIELSGAVVHSIDELVVGDRIIEHIPRKR